MLRPERYSGIQEGESDVEEDPEEDEDRAKCVVFFFSRLRQLFFLDLTGQICIVAIFEIPKFVGYSTSTINNQI